MTPWNRLPWEFDVIARVVDGDVGVVLGRQIGTPWLGGGPPCATGPGRSNLLCDNVSQLASNTIFGIQVRAVLARECEYGRAPDHFVTAIALGRLPTGLVVTFSCDSDKPLASRRQGLSDHVM